MAGTTVALNTFKAFLVIRQVVQYNIDTVVKWFSCYVHHDTSNLVPLSERGFPINNYAVYTCMHNIKYIYIFVYGTI